MNILSKQGRNLLFGSGETAVPDSDQAPWKDFPLTKNLHHLDIGPLKIWFQVKNDDLWLSWWRAQDTDELTPDYPAESDWVRWGLNSKYDKIVIRPAMAENPVLIIPEIPLIVAPKVQIKVYVRTPVWVQCYLKRKDHLALITEIPTVQLTKTWFGSTTEGEVCWGKKSRVPRTVDLTVQGDHHCISPIVIRNSSNEELKIERICHRAKNLEVYFADGRLWSNATRITFRDKIRGSQIRVQESVPEEISNEIILANAREKPEKNLMAKAFTQIRHASMLEL